MTANPDYSYALVPYKRGTPLESFYVEVVSKNRGLVSSVMFLYHGDALNAMNKASQTRCFAQMKHQLMRAGQASIDRGRPAIGVHDPEE